jgi:hypothetical protein
MGCILAFACRSRDSNNDNPMRLDASEIVFFAVLAICVIKTVKERLNK